MRLEYDSIIQKHTWEIVDLPPVKKFITAKWIYIIKHGLLDELPDYKARLVARGFE